ncbi:DUF4209 domain-containing protein [Acinetobacter baumannii]|uniref:DUF4209 domain-containing protein n=1 Tax=Acinetobacter baumannii TaxID=470 RepID=UPI0024DE01D7|nr:DUF4209 domain-containing protein [Acinetobacter baumannii]MDK2172843.1 DUF4209 domain-containing protein [Acinetobacter baumannii]MDK2183705.1 DUF4209 domain-containing protein [Acinetobacter baumannii]MDK2329529.1 DUF4209 domain-containing protein [Acinetobacter baumannii]
MSKNLDDLLNELDNQNFEDQKDHDIWMKIYKVSNDFPSHEAEMEKMAFYISEVKGIHIQSEWGFFYPHTQTNDSRGLIEYPTLEEITEDHINYWKKRCEQTKNIFMKLRYMGLVLVFEKEVLKTKNYQLTCSYIELLIDICTKNRGDALDLIRYAKRALSLAKSINNKNLIENSILNLISLEDKISDISLAGTWGFCFEKLILEKEKKLTEEQKQKIVKDMEDKFDYFSKKDDLPSYFLLNTLEPLSDFYRSINDNKKLESILEVYSDRVKKYIKNVSPIVASTELINLHTLLIKNNLHSEAENILVLLNKNGKHVINNLSCIEQSHEISHEAMDELLKSNTEGPFDEMLERLILKNVISKENVLKIIELKRKQAPLLYFFGQTIIDDEGRITQKIDSNEDSESVLLREMSNSIIINSSFFDLYLREIIKKNKKSCQDLVDLIYKSPVFKVENRQIIYKGIEAFLNEDHIICVHLLIPQIEAAFKQCIDLQTESIFQKNKFKGMNFLTLDSLINKDSLKNIYDEETIFYFRCVLSDPRGLNIRNDVCHGIINADKFNFSYSLLVMHIILLLAKVNYGPSSS